MQYFTEHGDTHAEVLAKVRSKYGSGPDVLISHQREVPVKSVWGKITRATRWEIHGALLEKNKTQPKKKDETIDNKLKLLEEMLNRTSFKKSVDAANGERQANSQQGANSFEGMLTREIQPSLKKEMLPISVTPPSVEHIRKLEAEVAELKNALKAKGGPDFDLVKERELLSLYEHCVAIGFSESFAESLAMRTRAGVASTDFKLRKKIHARAREVLAEHVRTTSSASQRIITLVGPTGAGKTTTLVKLAARLSVMQKHRVELITIDNYYEIFNGILNPKQLEGLRLLVTQFPQQQFNATEDRRTDRPSLGVTCFDCHANGHTNGANHLVADMRPQEFRHRIETPTLRGVNIQQLFGSQRALKTVEDFTEFE